MLKITIMFIIFAILVFSVPVSSFADDGVALVSGDHLELVCGEDGLVVVHHSIIESANVTRNVTTTATYSFKGTLVGEITAEIDPEIITHDILYKSENGITVIIVNFTATESPLKFVKFNLLYTLKEMIVNENGTWRFRYTFNTASTNPPEIVVKIPKPPMFRKLVVESTIPSPKLYTEETDYFGLVFSQPLFTFGETSSTSIDIKYTTLLDWNAVLWWGILTIASIAVGFVLGYFGKKIQGRLGKKSEGKNPTFEIFRDKEKKYRFRLKAANGETIATSEAYESKQGCKKRIEAIMETVSKATLEESG
jgi:uncharacterized protein YegP (UPF0339 family)